MNGMTYLTFTADHPLAEAVKRFENRFGRAPKEVKVDPVLPGVRLLRVGPVEEDDRKEVQLSFDEEQI